MAFQPDWIIHYVQGHTCDICNAHNEEYLGFYGFANIHTHGLEKYNHPEICIPLDIGGDVAVHLLNTLGYRIAIANERFQEGEDHTVLAGNYTARFVKFDMDDKLYLILPDVNNRLPGDIQCESPYSQQLFYAEIIHNDY